MSFKEVQELTKEVFALLCEEDKEVLYKYAKKVPENGVIVDVGTARGGSALIMALASKPSVKIYTMDPDFHQEVLDLIEKFNLVGKVIYTTETSESFFSKFDQQVDMIFIDGWHSYDAVMNDYKKSEDKIKKGATVAFHDII